LDVAVRPATESRRDVFPHHKVQRVPEGRLAFDYEGVSKETKAARMSQLSFFDSRDTLTEAKQAVQSMLGEGIRCPCCGQYARRYRFGLSEKNIYLLSRLYHMTGNTEDYVHIDRLADYARARIKGGTSFSILAWWNLIHERVNTDKDKKTSGFWRVTDLGVDFLHGVARVPKYVYSFNDTIEINAEDPFIPIGEIPWKRFSYEELMRG
jgi:hypothetical protein